MRLLASLLTILGLIIVSGVWLNHSLQSSADELNREIAKVVCEIENDSWEAAIKHSKEVQNTWEQKARWWPIFLHHQEIDNIEFSLAKIEKYIAAHNYSLSLGHLSELKLMIEHIPQKEALTLQNIL